MTLDIHKIQHDKWLTKIFVPVLQELKEYINFCCYFVFVFNLFYYHLKRKNTASKKRKRIKKSVTEFLVMPLLVTHFTNNCQNPCNNINSILSVFSLDLSCKTSSAEKLSRKQKPCFIISIVFSPNLIIN